MLKKCYCIGMSGLTLLATVAMLLLSVGAFAQSINTSKIEGTVRDKDTGQPLQGVQVVVEGTRLGNITNADGYYFILNVSPGRKDITFTYTGYQKTTINDNLVLAGQTVTINATLSSTVVELEGITVQSEAEALVPRDNTVSKQRMTAEKIAEIPANKLEDMFLLEAGVQTGGPEALGRGIRIRGGRLGEEAMIIDGVTVRNYSADPFRSGLGWVWEEELGSLAEDATPLEFSAGAVEQVDIITGGFQAEYGNAQSGVVNIVTKEGGPDWKGNVRFTTDEINDRTADYGYNQLMASIGGPMPVIPNMYIQGSGEIQGMADRQPTHADQGFRGLNQNFVDRLNDAVRNDPVFGAQQPAFTLEDLALGRAFYASKTPGANASLWVPGNPVRIPGNWADRTLVSSKLTYYPVQNFKFLGSFNFSRNQNSYPARDAGNYFFTGIITPGTLPSRDWAQDYPDTIIVIPQSYARRTRTTNLLLGFDWDFFRSSQRSASVQFRYTRFKTQDISSSSLKDDYIRSENTTFGGWSMHDIPFEVETIPGLNMPLFGTPEASMYYPDGVGPWMRNWAVENPFRLETENDLYWESYFYSREWQNNYKGDLDFQLNRTNRAKAGVQFSDFTNHKFELHNMMTRRDFNNEFSYRPTMLGVYFQNRTDLGDFVFDYGLRYDRFDPVDNWGVRNGDPWGDFYYPKNIDEWSPRFDVGFPVTDKAQIRFSYGVFTQLPSFSYMFSGSNPGGLEFSRTDAFESGLSYLLGEDMVADFVAYYRDVVGNVSSKEFFRTYYAAHAGRLYRDFETGFTNRDNGNIKGLDFTLRKRFSNNFSYNVVYTLQFSRTTGSQYGTTSEFGIFLDPSTGEMFTPPDELRPIDGDVTHKLTFNLNYLFPEDFMSGSLYNTILRDLRVYSILTLASGQPAYDRIVNGGSTYWENAAEDVSWLTRRGGRLIGGINYFRGRWDYNLDLRLTKTFRLAGSNRLSFYGELFNVFDKKLPTPYPSGLNYESYYRTAGGGVVMVWDDALPREDKVWFNSDYNQDGVLSLEEQAKGNIAYSVMSATMDKSQWGIARQFRLGAEFTF